jgi:hypothetical protein
VPSIVFAVNKLDAVEDPTLAFNNIAAALAGVREAARHPGEGHRADVGAEGLQRGRRQAGLVRL